MANAVRTTRVIERMVKETITDGVTLTLSADEAQMLAQTLGVFGGDLAGARKHQWAIKEALQNIGYLWESNRHRALFGDANGIYFDPDAKWEPVS